MNATRIAFFTAFKPLRPGAEEMMAPFIEASRVFLTKLGELLAYEPIVTTPDEGQKAVKELLSKSPDVFVVLVTGGVEASRCPPSPIAKTPKVGEGLEVFCVGAAGLRPRRPYAPRVLRCHKWLPWATSTWTSSPISPATRPKEATAWLRG